MKAPFRSPNKIIVTQEFGDISRVAYYKTNNINIPFHNGTDIILGDARVTYGTECVCPFPNAKVVKVTFDTPTSTKGNGVTIESEAVDNTKYQVVFWHTGEVAVKEGQYLKEGDVVCYIGNSGLCNPAPTEVQPWNGSHCHLMLFKYVYIADNRGSRWELQDGDNGVNGARNPRELFDLSQCYVGKDTGLIHDMWVLKQYVVNKTGTTLAKYFKSLGL